MTLGKISVGIIEDGDKKQHTVSELQSVYEVIARANNTTSDDVALLSTSTTLSGEHYLYLASTGIPYYSSVALTGVITAYTNNSNTITVTVAGTDYTLSLVDGGVTNVLSLGVVNDGTTEFDIATVLDYQAATGKAVYWPAGKYLCTTGGYDANFYFEWFGVGLQTIILWQPATDTYLFNQQLDVGDTSPSTDTGDEGTLNGANIKDMVILGNRSQLCSGIKFEQCDKLWLQNLYIYGIKGTSIELNSCREFTLNGVRTRYNGDRSTQRPDVDLNADNSASENTNFAHIINCFFIYSLWTILSFDDCSAMIASDIMLHNIPLGTEYTGTHDGSDDESVLTDSGESWTVNGFVGKIVRNLTDGSQGTITANTATTITATLSGGTDNDWDTDDIYVISSSQETSVKTYYNNLFGNTTDIDDWYDTWYQTDGAIDAHTLSLTNGTNLRINNLQSYGGGSTPVSVDGSSLYGTNIVLNGSDKRNGADYCIEAVNSGTINIVNVTANNTQQIFNGSDGNVSLSGLNLGSAIGGTQSDYGSLLTREYGSKYFYGDIFKFTIVDGNGNGRTLSTVSSGNNVHLTPSNGVVYTLGPIPYNANYSYGDIWYDDDGDGSARIYTNNGLKALGLRVSVPSTSSTAGRVGDWAGDSSYFYWYTGDGSTHTWARVAVTDTSW